MTHSLLFLLGLWGKTVFHTSTIPICQVSLWIGAGFRSHRGATATTLQANPRSDFFFLVSAPQCRWRTGGGTKPQQFIISIPHCAGNITPVIAHLPVFFEPRLLSSAEEQRGEHSCGSDELFFFFFFDESGHGCY